MNFFLAFNVAFLAFVFFLGYIFILVPKMISVAHTGLNVFGIISLPFAAYALFLALRDAYGMIKKKEDPRGSETTSEEG